MNISQRNRIGLNLKIARVGNIDVVVTKDTNKVIGYDKNGKFAQDPLVVRTLQNCYDLNRVWGQDNEQPSQHWYQLDVYFKSLGVNTMLNDYLTDADKYEIISIGIQEGSVFINDEGIAVDAWDDPIFLEDVTDE